MKLNIPRMMVAMLAIVATVWLVACGGEAEVGEEVVVPESPIEVQSTPTEEWVDLKVGEFVPLPGSGPTEEAPIAIINVVITDAQSGEPVVADIWVNEQKVGSGQSVYSLALPGKFYGVLGVKAKGYKDFAAGMQYTMKRSRTIYAPVRMEKDLEASI